MTKETIIIKRPDKYRGGYDYVEFSIEHKEYVTDHSGSHWGHGWPLLEIEISSTKRLKEYIAELELQQFKKIETFTHRPNYKGDSQ